MVELNDDLHLLLPSKSDLTFSKENLVLAAVHN